MSLINDMLRDLDRRRPAGQTAVIAGDVRPVPRAGRAGRIPWGGVLALAGLVGIAGVAWVAASGREDALSVQPLALVETLPEQQAQGSEPALQVAMLTPAPETRATVTPRVRWVGVDSQQMPGETRVSLRFSASVPETVALQREGDDAYLPLTGVELRDAPALPVAPATGPLGGLGISHEDEPMLQFRARPGSTVALERDADGRRLTLVFRAPESAVAMAPSRAERVAHADSANPMEETRAYAGSRTEPTLAEPQRPRQVAAQPANPVARRSHADLYAQAMEAVRRGDLSTGERELRRVLERAPHLHEARESLATLLASDAREQEAMALLQAGLREAPARSESRVLLARLMAGRNDLDGAVALLEAGAGDAETLAALAALYQRQGRAEAAVAAYRRALSARNDVGGWWVGLGIALESAGSAAGAPQAYRRALALGGVDPRLTDYAQSRILALEGRP
ncbi:tetratricopeptide repeat protein [Thioalkalivibrio sulfidiphilus]|uniref:tetratricopeptide repeat protein n=1 Tax=Thioalkalivibrio sulfidiphilus TaxID=1033854 RepID=UPI0003826CFA|nr:tetratricopeptide repeat protein [Thioalkalivibrio sulfidiphilus]